MVPHVARSQQVRLLTGHDGTPLLDVSAPSISRDGRTLLVFANGREVDPGLPDETQMLVLRAGQTAPVLAMTPAEPDAYQGRLAADGNHVAYRTRFSTGYSIVVRTVNTGAEWAAHATVGRPVPVLVDVNEDGRHVLLVDRDLDESSRVIVARHAGLPPVAMEPPCIGCGIPQSDASSTSRISADGSTVTFISVRHLERGIVKIFRHALGDVGTGTTECVGLDDPRVYPAPTIVGTALHLSRTARFVAGTAELMASGSAAFVLDRADGSVHLVGRHLSAAASEGISDDGRYVLLTAASAVGTGRGLWLVDRTTGAATEISANVPGTIGVSGLALSGDGSTVIFQMNSQAEGLRTYIASLDVDGDGLHDAWETTFGLEPSTAADASLDADGDGRTNAQEYEAGTHPKGTPLRYFAEGADGTFFSTSLALFNPASTPATVNVRFLGPDGAGASRPVALAAQAPAYVDVGSLGLPFTEFSIAVEGASQITAERRMTWGTLSSLSTHTGTGVATPSSIWHFAEGATVAGMQTFFLLQNPGTLPAVATMQYLLADGTVQQRTHTVPAQSRLTVWANQEGTPLQSAEFATTISSDQPLVAERAMYRDAEGRLFAAGSVVAGVAAPATSWFLAEGATGSFFDTYLLLSNPGDTAATVDVEFIRAHDFSDINTAFPVPRRYVVAPHSRRTVWVSQEDPALRTTEVATRLQSSGPIVAERSMWWPGPTSASWREVHAQAGASSSGKMWAVADVQSDATEGGWDTFILVATTEQYIARIRVSASCDDGTRVSRDRSISVNRTTLWMRYELPEIVGKRCAATVESLPTRITLTPIVPLTRVPLVVEKAMYYGSGFVGGDVSLATRLPDPVDPP
jgi:hypothetical protein